MKREEAWIVASLILFTELASADGEITIYGVADLTFESVRAAGAATSGADQPKRQRVSNNSSLIGFKGTEDLGGGLQAIFQVESATNMDAGTGSFSTRDTFVGMKGGLGTIKAGFMTAPMRALGGKLNFI